MDKPRPQARVARLLERAVEPEWGARGTGVKASVVPDSGECRTMAGTPLLARPEDSGGGQKVR